MHRFVVARLASLCFFLSPVASAAAQQVPADIEQLVLYDALLRVHTCNQAGAETNSPAFVRFYGVRSGSTWASREAEEFYLSGAPPADRQRNHTDVWSVSIPNVRKVDDIRRIQIFNDGHDAWCIDRVELAVNSSTIFTKDMPGGVWLDLDATASYKIDYDELRSNRLWNARPSAVNTGCRLPKTLSNSMLDEKIESMLGDVFADPRSALESARWNSAGLTVSRASSKSLNVRADFRLPTSVDLGITSLNGWVNLVATSRLDVTCGPQTVNGAQVNVLKISSTQPTVVADTPWYLDVLTIGLADDAVEWVFDQVSDNLVESLTSETPYCPAINVSSTGDVQLTWPTLVFPFIGAVDTGAVYGATCPAVP